MFNTIRRAVRLARRLTRCTLASAEAECDASCRFCATAYDVPVDAGRVAE